MLLFINFKIHYLEAMVALMHSDIFSNVAVLSKVYQSDREKQHAVANQQPVAST